MAHYLDPKNDLTFKCVFGKHKHLCMSLNENTKEIPQELLDNELTGDFGDTRSPISVIPVHSI